jgi:hypothetical protein
MLTPCRTPLFSSALIAKRNISWCALHLLREMTANYSVKVAVVRSEIARENSLCSTSPLTGLAGAQIEGAGRYGSGAAGHGFNLTANTGHVCPACNTGVAAFATLFCICEWCISAIFRSGSVQMLFAAASSGQLSVTHGQSKPARTRLDFSCVYASDAGNFRN